jgi:hypothetical protein
MIFSIDHITLTCSDAEQACSYVKAMGYKENFSALDVSNPLIKRNLMRDWCDRHDLFFFEKPGSFNIEVIKYEHVHNGVNFLSPVLENAQHPFTDESLLAVEEMSGKTIIVFAENLEMAYQFWSLFGLKVLKKEHDHYWCVFRTPFSQEIFFIMSSGRVVLHETDIDSAGFNCVAFRSASLASDRQLLLNQGIEVTSIEEVKFNGKNLSIFFAVGRQGEKVEVIGYNKNG